MKKSGRLRLVAAAAALVAVSVAGVSSSASATPPSKQGAAAVKTFTFKGDRKTMRLEGPAQIRQGATLKIKNKTDAGEVGPHTFTLAKASEIPKTKKQQKKCANLRTPFCAAVAFEWHLFEPPNTINRPLSDVNEDGWDTMGDRETIGDSWFTGRKGEGFSAPVSADPGTLRYFCVVHPDLKGKLQVTAGPTS